MNEERTPGALGSNDQLGLAPERAAFERWCADNGHGTLDDMMMPMDRALKNLLWSAWQACWPLARAAIYSAEQAQIEAPLRAQLERHKPLVQAAEWIVEDGHMHTEDLARLRAALNAL